MAAPRLAVKDVSSAGQYALAVGKEEEVLEGRAWSVPITFANPSLAEHWPTLREAPKFTKWVEKFATNEELTLGKVEVLSVKFNSDNSIQAIQVDADITRNKNGAKVPGLVLIRGDSVAVLVVLRVNSSVNPNAGPGSGRLGGGGGGGNMNPVGGDDDSNAMRPRDHVVFVKQARAGIVDGEYYEIPSGHLDYSGSFQSEAARELRDLCGIQIDASGLVNMTAVAFRRRRGNTLPIPRVGVAASPGSLDERVQIFIYRQTVTAAELQAIRYNMEGSGEEKTHLAIVPLGEAWRYSTDAKTMAALFLLYELRYHGSMPRYTPPRQAMTVRPVIPLGKRKPVYSFVEQIDPNTRGINLKVKVHKPAQRVPRVNDSGYPESRALESLTHLAVVGDATGTVNLRLTENQAKLAGMDSVGSPFFLRNISYDMAGNHIAVMVDDWGKIAAPTATEMDQFEFTVDASEATNASRLEYRHETPGSGEEDFDEGDQAQVATRPRNRSYRNVRGGRGRRGGYQW